MRLASGPAALRLVAPSVSASEQGHNVSLVLGVNGLALHANCAVEGVA